MKQHQKAKRPRTVDPLSRREHKDQIEALKRENDELVDQLRDALARQEFLDAIPEAKPPKIWRRERSSSIRELTPVVLASDWHVEEPVTLVQSIGRNEYNLKIADKRVKRFFDSIIWNVEHHRASGRIVIRDLVLWLGGDLMTGYIHPELIENNLLSPTETVRWLIPRLRNGIATLLETLGLERLIIPCSHGNHGRTTEKSRVVTGYANSFEWLMYHSLADEFRSDKRVRFEITDAAHQYVQVYDYWLHFHHGDDVRYQGGIGGLGIPLLKAVAGWDEVKRCDVHNIGHWHQLRDYGRAVVNGSLIGYGAYSMKIRAPYEVPKQAMYFVDSRRGKCLLTDLWVADRDRKVA